MKTTTIKAMTVTAATFLGGSALLGAATGLPILFGLWLAAGLVSAVFGASVVLQSIASPARKPLTLATAVRGRTVPVTRPARVAA